MQAFPPAEPDQAYQQRFAPLGLLDAASPYADCPPELSQALTTGEQAARQQMETTLKKGGLAPVINGWTLTFHMFDYNLDHLGPGSIDDPAWKIADRGASYLARALAARGGLWGNHGYEAAYPMTYTDADGEQLDGHNRYTLRFDARSRRWLEARPGRSGTPELLTPGQPDARTPTRLQIQETPLPKNLS